MQIKPQLADNYNPENIVLPTIAQIKVDGVRALNLEGRLTGRSLKEFKNKALTDLFSFPELIGLDGELAYGEMHSPRLCSETTGISGTIRGTAEGFTWWVFDLVTHDTIDLPYEVRFQLLQDRVAGLKRADIKVMPHKVLDTVDEVEAYDLGNLEAGFEGTILRNPDARYKAGRPNRLQQLMRIKRFSDSEAVVLSVTEGRVNMNEAKTDLLGRTERSSHAENQVPSGLLGSLICRDLVSGVEITVSAGAMDHSERLDYFENQDKLLGKVIKYKYFAHGVKDLPRFPTFLSLRDEVDMS